MTILNRERAKVKASAAPALAWGPETDDERWEIGPGPVGPTEADSRWWAESSPGNSEGYCVEGESSPADVELRTISAHAHFLEFLDPADEYEALDRLTDGHLL